MGADYIADGKQINFVMRGEKGNVLARFTVPSSKVREGEPLYTEFEGMKVR